MKKLIASLTIVLVLAPAAFFMCHCCPMTASQNSLQIKAVDCRACCPQAFETVKDCAIIKNHSSYALFQSKVLDAFTGALSMIKIMPVSENRSLDFPIKAPPLITASALSTVLRI